MPRSSDSSSPSRARPRRRRDRRRRRSPSSSSRSPRRSPSRRPSLRLVFLVPFRLSFSGLSLARISEPVRSPSWVPQPLHFAPILPAPLPRPDLDRHPPVVVPKACMPLYPFLPSCVLRQVDLPVSVAAASCTQAFSILIFRLFCAMSRIGGLHPLRQLARLTGATGTTDQTSSGRGAAVEASVAPDPAGAPSDGASAAAPPAAAMASGGDGASGPAAAAPGPSTGGDGAPAAPPTGLEVVRCGILGCRSWPDSEDAAGRCFFGPSGPELLIVRHRYP